jgi:hypothetical protein
MLCGRVRQYLGTPCAYPIAPSITDKQVVVEPIVTHYYELKAHLFIICSAHGPSRQGGLQVTNSMWVERAQVLRES